MNQYIIIPILGIFTRIIVPIAAFIWMYFDKKNKRKTVLEISKHLDDPAKLDKLIAIFDERKKEPIDYRRNGLITMFVGIGLYLFGYVWMGKILEAVGLLVGVIGIGTLIAGYLYPNIIKKPTTVVEKSEKR